MHAAEAIHDPGGQRSTAHRLAGGNVPVLIGMYSGVPANKGFIPEFKALQEEAKELDAELLWKWWSKDKINMQNIRVEIVDIMHFLVSLALAAGLTAEEFHRLYTAKHKVNEQRQEQGYSKETKNEADNKSVV